MVAYLVKETFKSTKNAVMKRKLSNLNEAAI